MNNENMLLGMVFKWFFDRFAAFFGLIILAPVMLVIVVLIKVKMPNGSVFFVQKRVGKDGKLFNCHKFRTMVTVKHNFNNEWTTITVSGDKRITRLGALLRKYKIDELPGLWDVLIGKMSFVGPRPDVPGYADELTGNNRDVLKLRPGITGPATLKYRCEEQLIADYVKSMLENGDKRSPQEIAAYYNDEIIFPDKVRLNCYYYRHFSLLMDLKIIFATILNKKILFAGEYV